MLPAAQHTFQTQYQIAVDRLIAVPIQTMYSSPCALGAGSFARRKRSAHDSFEPEALRSYDNGSLTLEPAPAAPRNVQQRRNPVNHTDLASVLELIEELDGSAHTGATSKDSISWLRCAGEAY